MRRALRLAIRFGGGLAALALVYLGITFVQVAMAAGKDQRDPVDAIIVLGAAQYNGEPSPALKGRLDHALDLYEDGVAPEVVLTGGKRSGDRYTEAFAGFRYLRDRGVPDRDLVLITDGANTWESLAAASRQLRETDDTDVVLVSDPYHSLRVLGTADELGLDATVSPTSKSSSITELSSETVAVATGRIIGYRRLLRLR